MSEISAADKESRWTKIKRGLKTGAKKIIPVAVGWAAGAIFPPAGGALYKFLKDKLSESPLPIEISDDNLKSICNESVQKKSIEVIQQKLREQLEISSKLNKQQIELMLGSYLRPINESLNDALDYIKTYPDQVSYLMQEWKAENKELIDQLHLDMEAGFNSVQATIESKSAEIMSGMTNIMRTLSKFENMMDRDFASNVKSIFSSDTITPFDLKLVSQAQLSMTDYSSRFDIAFDPNLFVTRKDAEDAFFDFLQDLSSPFSSNKNCFLVLAGAGMGKTWTLAHHAHSLSEGEHENFVPFFIPLKLGLESQLNGYFGAANKSLALINLKKAKDTSEITPILFFDGLDEIKPAEAREVLSFILDLSRNKIASVLACRNTDWAREEKIIEMHSDFSDIVFEHQAGSSYEIIGVACKPSLNLSVFTEEEFQNAAQRYGIPISSFYNSTLKQMALRPILLRLLADFYKNQGKLPNPENPTDFETIFIGQKGDSPQTHILGRLGIIGPKRDYLIRLVARFVEKGKELKSEDLLDLINEKDNFKTVRSAGLIKEEWGRLSTHYILDDTFYAQLIHIVNLAGIKIGKEKATIVAEKRADSLTTFKGVQIFQSEADIMQDLENRLVKQMKLVKEVDVGSRLCFSTENNHITGISLRQCELSNFPESITDLKFLKNLELSMNDISTIPESIENLSSLANLWLNSNQIANLPEAFWSLKSLQMLELGSNKLGLVNLSDKIGQLSSLKELSLFDNQLSTLPESIGNLKSLEVLDLNGNQLSTLPEALWNLKVLKMLLLYQNKLTTLSGSLVNLSSLEFLDLRWNEFTTFPEAVCKLHWLTELILLGNDFNSIPECIGDLKSLKNLDLDYNKLTTLPESIGQLKALQSLKVNYNLLKTLPESIGNLTSLQILNLYKNKLTTLPQSIHNLSSLFSINISENPLDSKANSLLEQLRVKGVRITNVAPQNVAIASASQTTEVVEKIIPDSSMQFLFGEKTPFQELTPQDQKQLDFYKNSYPYAYPSYDHDTKVFTRTKVVEDPNDLDLFLQNQQIAKEEYEVLKNCYGELNVKEIAAKLGGNPEKIKLILLKLEYTKKLIKSDVHPKHIERDGLFG